MISHKVDTGSMGMFARLEIQTDDFSIKTGMMNAEETRALANEYQLIADDLKQAAKDIDGNHN